MCSCAAAPAREVVGRYRVRAVHLEMRPMRLANGGTPPCCVTQAELLEVLPRLIRILDGHRSTATVITPGVYLLHTLHSAVEDLVGDDLGFACRRVAWWVWHARLGGQEALGTR